MILNQQQEPPPQQQEAEEEGIGRICHHEECVDRLLRHYGLCKNLEFSCSFCMQELRNVAWLACAPSVCEEARQRRWFSSCLLFDVCACPFYTCLQTESLLPCDSCNTAQLNWDLWASYNSDSKLDRAVCCSRSPNCSQASNDEQHHIPSSYRDPEKISVSSEHRKVIRLVYMATPACSEQLSASCIQHLCFQAWVHPALHQTCAKRALPLFHPCNLTWCNWQSSSWTANSLSSALHRPYTGLTRTCNNGMCWGGWSPGF